MNKELLVRHMEGGTSLEERVEVIHWIDKSDENEVYYVSLMDLVLTEKLLREDTEDMILSQEEKGKIYGELKVQISKSHLAKKRIFVFKRAVSVVAVLVVLVSVFFNIYGASKLGNTKGVEGEVISYCDTVGLGLYCFTKSLLDIVDVEFKSERFADIYRVKSDVSNLFGDSKSYDISFRVADRKRIIKEIK